MSSAKIRVAIVGCGNIATRYAEQIKGYPTCDLLGFSDVELPRAQALAAKHGGQAYTDLAAVLADPAIDLVVNLTIHHAHYAVTKACLLAGKHVHSEKPITLSYREAKELVELAATSGLRLSSAPITYMGEAQQTAWKLLRAGKAGQVRLAYAEINHGRIEDWHPNPGPFYSVGVLWDVGVYPLTLLTTMFGPVRRVTAAGKVVHPDRVTKEGKAFHIDTPDFVTAMLEFEGGLTARFTANFYVQGGKQRGGIELVGDLGSIYLGDFQLFSAPVEFAPYGKPYEPVPPVKPVFEGIEFARGVEEMSKDMLAGRPQRSTGAHAAHIVEILEAIETSIKRGGGVAVSSNFVQPTPMDWAQ